MIRKIGFTGVGAILVVILFFISICSVIHHIKCINFSYPLEYREGVVQYWVNCFVDEKPLYPKIGEEPPYIHNPYGPLYFIIAGIFQKLLPEKHTFFAPRLVSFLTLLITCLFIFKIIRSRCACLMAGLLGATFFLCSPVSINYGSLGIVDIVALGLGFAGLYAVTGKTKIGFLFSGIFCSGAFLTKLIFMLPGISIFIAILLAKEKEK
ncbi:MAG: glycosyltransferase family 39 protein, partial [Candidatus Omnitrophica bacterium]|nr:glycosyltransferase family 39 protein [Candidatus Omnitrophota bacterium]